MTGTGTGLHAELALTVGPLTLDVSLTIAPGEPTAVLGPNGAGKTTLLRALAGLQPLRSGRIELDGAPLDHLPAERRPVGMVFQHGALFPRLSALDNVAFGLRARGVRRAQARARAGEWLERVDLSHRAAALPSTLSGGEAQRVALARALAVEPRLLLLDEPLSALDASARAATRRHLRRHLREFGGVAVVVTHDPVEAMALAERIVVIEEGGVVQTGTPAEVAARPRSAYVADLAGVNLLSGRAEGGVVVTDGGGRLVVPDAPDGDVFVVVHPRAVALHRTRPDGTPRNVWEAPVAGVDPEGARARVSLGGELPMAAEVTREAVADLGLAEGVRVWAAVKATEVSVFPA